MSEPAWKTDYRNAHPRCELWPLLLRRVRRAIGGNEFDWHRPAEQMAHICNGAGRIDHPSNLLHLNSAVHQWCDSHGAAGRVCLFYAKFRHDGAEWGLWDDWFVGARSVGGWLQTDKVIQQCALWELEPWRLELLRDFDRHPEGVVTW